jgi:hypothetical protein
MSLENAAIIPCLALAHPWPHLRPPLLHIFPKKDIIGVFPKIPSLQPGKIFLPPAMRESLAKLKNPGSNFRDDEVQHPP